MFVCLSWSVSMKRRHSVFSSKKETKEKEEEDVWIWKRANKQTNERTNVVGSGFWTTLQKDLSIKNWTCFRLKKWRPLLQSTAANLQKSWQVLASRHTWARSGHEKSTPTTGRFYLFRFSTFFKILIIKLKPRKTLARPKEHSQVNKATQPLLNWALTVFCDKDICVLKLFAFVMLFGIHCQSLPQW